MWEAVKSITALLLSFGLLLMGNGMTSTLLGIRSRLEGFSTETTGFILAGFFVGMLIGAVQAIRIVAAVGHVRAFAAFASLASVAILLHLLFVYPIVWFGLRVLGGFCMAGMVMVVQSWVNERAPNALRGRIMSIYMIINFMGAGLGQFMLLTGNPDAFELFVIASVVYSVALVPILLSNAEAPRPASPDRAKLRELLRISPVGVCGTFCAGLINSSVNAMGPVFAKETGLAIADVSTFMASVILGGMVLQFPLGRLSDKFDRRVVMAVAAAATGTAAFGVIWASEMNTVMLFAAGALLGGFCFTVLPLSSSQVNDRADPAMRVQVASGLLIAFGVGASLGPVLAGQMMAQGGPAGLMWFLSTVCAALVVFTLVRMALRDGASEDEKAPFIPLAGNAGASRQLYTAAMDDTKSEEEKP